MDQLARVTGSALILDTGSPERTAEYDDAARRHDYEAAPANTRAGYESDWRVWRKFCEYTGDPLYMVSEGVLSAFAKWMSQQMLPPTEAAPWGMPYSSATIERRLMGTVATLRHELGVEKVPKGITALALKVIERHRAAYRRLKPGRGKAKTVWPTEIAKACLKIDRSDLPGIRDFALLLCWIYLGSRRDEMSRLQWEDLTCIVEEGRELGFAVLMPVTKSGERDAVIPHDHPEGPCPDLCPVRALRHWRDACEAVAGEAASGGVFRRIDRWGNVLPKSMSGQSCATRLRECCELAGIPNVRSHGVRGGHISDARRRGLDETAVRLQTGHAPGSKALHGYFDIGDRWTESSASGLGERLAEVEYDEQ